MGNIDNKIVGEEIIKSFHEQFAQNQNHHQNLFLQILALLLTVLVGFGYLYIHIGTEDKTVHVTYKTLYAFLVLAMYLLSLAITLILNMALGFRRDQLVACNIRSKTGVMGNTNPDDDYFIASFNPVGKEGYIAWMPGFHSIFFIGLLIIKLLLILCLVFGPETAIKLSCSPDTLITGSILLAFGSYIIDILAAYSFRKKWIDYSKNAPARLRPQKRQ